MPWFEGGWNGNRRCRRIIYRSPWLDTELPWEESRSCDGVQFPATLRFPVIDLPTDFVRIHAQEGAGLSKIVEVLSEIIEDLLRFGRIRTEEDDST